MVDQVFDTWPLKYERWFQTPIGKLVHSIELRHIMELLEPDGRDRILDVGCGTGIFTENYVQAGARLTGIDLSLPMLKFARQKPSLSSMLPAVADMRALPFADGWFDKTVSITALEFVVDASQAVDELLRVTRRGGRLVIATLNSRSPWAECRRRDARQQPDSVFRHVRFRSPQELADLVRLDGRVRTAVHFEKDATPDLARRIEKRVQSRNSDRGAFVIGTWTLP
jgi:ubiquinone/menaquinone biosynthesis C-methylase UbiE